MSRFNIGDKVRVMNNELSQPKDHIGRIFTISKTGLTVCYLLETTYIYEDYQLAGAQDFLNRDAFTAHEPACKQNQDWMLQHLKDIASELEVEGDAKLWDAVQDLDES